MGLRIACTGASGTGKTTIMSFIQHRFLLEQVPIGSRSIAKAMGFDSPYDVDQAGKRGEFQRRLVTEKMAWEAEHQQFVTDRTVFDNLVYTILHGVRSIDEKLLDAIVSGMKRYTHIFFCPVDTFCNLEDDPHRIQDLTYQRIYEAVLEGVLDRWTPALPTLHWMYSPSLERRTERICEILKGSCL